MTSSCSPGKSKYNPSPTENEAEAIGRKDLVRSEITLPQPLSEEHCEAHSLLQDTEDEVRMSVMARERDLSLIHVLRKVEINKCMATNIELRHTQKLNLIP